MFRFTLQGSENDTVVYVVGSPYYQNWQHVYTAVTRGVRQVIIIHNPSSFSRAITSHPVTRQTKLKEDIKQAMENRSRPDEHDDCLETNTRFGDVPKDGFAPQSIDLTSATPFSVPEGQEWASESSVRHLDAAASSNEFCISTENLRNKRLKNDQDEQARPAASSRDGTSCYGISAQPYEEMPVNASEVNSLQSPGHKRKHSESTVLMSPPQTPPRFKQFATSLSSVSPLNHASRETQHVVTSHQSAENIPAKKVSFTAQFDQQCRVCKGQIRKGIDKITPVRKQGSDKYWIHGGCATSDQL